MTPVISVIIPVYNVEKFLAKCIDSLLYQTFPDFEIILVNDGSADSSGKICDEYAKKDERIIVIHKENAGVVAARNDGINASAGRYITFIDTDDYANEDYLQTLRDGIKKHNADISTCNQFLEFQDGSHEELFKNKKKDYIVLSGMKSLSELLYGRVCSGFCGCKLYKRELVEDIKVPHFVMGEDSAFVYEAFVKADKIAHAQKCCYYYVQHPASATHTTDYIKFYDYIKKSEYYYNFAKEKHPELVGGMSIKLIENCFYVYMKLRKSDQNYPEEMKHIEKLIHKHKLLSLFNLKAKFRTRAACGLSLGGLKLLCFIYDKFGNFEVFL